MPGPESPGLGQPGPREFASGSKYAFWHPHKLPESLLHPHDIAQCADPAMTLPTIKPMLAKAATKVPDKAGVWSYEPKWGGFLD